MAGIVMRRQTRPSCSVLQAPWLAHGVHSSFTDLMTNRGLLCDLPLLAADDFEADALVAVLLGG